MCGYLIGTDLVKREGRFVGRESRAQCTRTSSNDRYLNDTSGRIVYGTVHLLTMGSGSG